MRILVYGAGAIGSAFGGFLSRGHEVTLLGRYPHMRVIASRGLEVTGIWGRHRFRRLITAVHARETGYRKRPFDMILVCVKAFAVRGAVRDVKRMAGPETVVVLMQNGIGHIENFHRVFPAKQILAARNIFGVEWKRPGQIRITVMASPTAVGETSVHRVTARVRRIARLFSQAGIASAAVRDIRSVLWAKMIYNAALNPLASLLGCRYGKLGEEPLTRRMMNEVIHEAYAVADRARVALKPATPAAYRRLFYGKLLPRTCDHHPSMLYDLRKRQVTEIEAINGALTRLGKELGVPVPVNRALCRLIRECERR